MSTLTSTLSLNSSLPELPERARASTQLDAICLSLWTKSSLSIYTHFTPNDIANRYPFFSFSCAFSFSLSLYLFIALFLSLCFHPILQLVIGYITDTRVSRVTAMLLLQSWWTHAAHTVDEKAALRNHTYLYIYIYICNVYIHRDW